MIKAKLFVSGIERELLWTNLEYERYYQEKSASIGTTPMGGLVTLAFVASRDDDTILRWMTHREENEFCKLQSCSIVFYDGGFDGPSLFEYKYSDAALVYCCLLYTSDAADD